MYIVQDRAKAIPVEEFSGHVQRMHADRDKWFEMEYNVSSMHALYPHISSTNTHTKTVMFTFTCYVPVSLKVLVSAMTTVCLSTNAPTQFTLRLQKQHIVVSVVFG